MTVSHDSDRAASREFVAAEVRAYMARRKITANQLPDLIGKSQSYWWRRLAAETAFDVDDLVDLAELLGVEAVVFLGGTPTGPRPGDPDGGLRVVRHERLERPTRWLSVAEQSLDLAA